MTVGSADLHKGIIAAWIAADLDAAHTTYWTATEISRFSPLQESGGAQAQTPFPHTIYQEGISSVFSRMTDQGETRTRVLRNIPWIFRVRAQSVTNVSKSAKEIASDIATSIMAVYGGHPTTAPSQICLDNGGVVLMKYEFDQSVAEGEDSHLISINYTVTTDIPVES